MPVPHDIPFRMRCWQSSSKVFDILTTSLVEKSKCWPLYNLQGHLCDELFIPANRNDIPFCSSTNSQDEDTQGVT